MHPQVPPLPPWVVLHLPHVSTDVPPSVRDQFLLDDHDLAAELEVLTDHHAIDLFVDEASASTSVRADVSRLVVDVERFTDDHNESAARHGFGAIYAKTTTGRSLRRSLRPEERAALLERHAVHHARLAVAVEAALLQHRRCLVLDCHTFPDRHLPFEIADAGARNRPDICIGTDPVHTPPELARAFVEVFAAAGWDVGVNRPFAGALVPAACSGRPGVLAIMVDANRRICTGANGPVSGPSHPVARRVRACCAMAIDRFDASVRRAAAAHSIPEGGA